MAHMEHDEVRVCSILAKQRWRYAVVGGNLGRNGLELRPTKRFSGSTGERGQEPAYTLSSHTSRRRAMNRKSF